MKLFSKCSRETGFTLVELSLAILFLAFILVFLFSTIVNVMAVYNKGVWVDQINQAARQIDADLADQVRFSNEDVDKMIRNASANGRLCVNGISYIWSKDGAGVTSPVTNYFSDGTRISLIRFIDPSGAYCLYTTNRPPRNSSGMVVLLNQSVAVLVFDVSKKDDKLINFHIVLSTTGTNRATPNGGDWQCFDGGSPNQYCAFTNLNFTVYRRGS